MVSQVIMVLKLLGSYIVNKKQFVETEHCDKVIENYSAQIIYTNR